MTLDKKIITNKYIFLYFLFNVFYSFCWALEPERDHAFTEAKGSAHAAALPWLIFPDGRGLPRGRGTVRLGQVIYAQRCLACHGVAGRGGAGGELAGGHRDLTRQQPDLTLGTYWPYAPPIFDFIRRSMPMDAPRSLSDDEVYAVTAYLLHLNGLLSENAELDAAALANVRMPNRDGFIGIDAAFPRPDTSE